MAKSAGTLKLPRPPSRANSASHALTNPDAGRFLREILEKALASPAGVAPRWLAEAWGLLANVLVNDYLHGWNRAGQAELNAAEDAVQNALAIEPNLALAHHAKGLIARARGRHEEARTAFEQAVRIDPDFARAHAQLGNELLLLGRPGPALRQAQKAIDLSPDDHASGTFQWIKGRIQFFDKKYEDAIASLEKSVKLLPTVWYNWLYLVSAYALADQKPKAEELLKEFQSRFGEHTLKHVAAHEGANPNSNRFVVKGREKFREGLTAAGMSD